MGERRNELIIQEPVNGRFSAEDFRVRQETGLSPVAVNRDGKTLYVLMDHGQSYDFAVHGKLPDGFK